MVELPAPSNTVPVPIGLPVKRPAGKQPLKAACPLCRHVTEVLPCAEYAPITCPGCGLRYKPNVEQAAVVAKSNGRPTGTDAPSDPLLQRWLAGEPIAPPQLTQWQRLLRWFRRHPAQGALLAATLFLLVTAAVAGTAGLCVTKLRLSHTARIWQQAEQERLQAEALAAEQARLAAEKQRQAEAEAAARLAAEQRAQKAEAERRRAELERLEAEKQRQQAARQARLALAEQQAKDALLLLHSQPLQSCMLAASSLQTKLAEGIAPDLHTQQILCDAIAELGVPTLGGHEGAITACETDCNGRLLATGGEDGALRVWNLEAASAGGLDAINTPRPTISAAHSATTCTAAAEKKHGPGGPNVAPLVLHAHGKPISAMAISPDGKLLASGDRSGLLMLWDLTASGGGGQPTVLHHFDSPVNAVVFSRDARWLVAMAGRPDSLDDTARLWNLSADGRPGPGLPLRGHFGQVRAAAFSPDGNWLATAGADRTVRLWNLRSNFPSAEQIVLHGHENQAAAVAFACDGRWLASASYDGTVRLWNLRQADPGANPLVLSGHNGWVDVIEVGPDGRYLASGGYDRTVRVWDLQAADPSQSCLVLSGHTARIRKIAFFDGGRRLATASDDRTVRIWDLSATAPSAQTLVLRGHWGPVVNICVTNSGKSLLTCSADMAAVGKTAVRIWPLHTADLLAQAMLICQRRATGTGQKPTLDTSAPPLVSPSVLGEFTLAAGQPADVTAQTPAPKNHAAEQSPPGFGQAMPQSFFGPSPVGDNSCNPEATLR